MTRLFLRLIFKNHPDANSPAAHAAAGNAASITGMVCNVLLFLGKLLAGLAAGSVSVTADAFNNLTDAASSVVALLGFRLARRPPDREHPYGHARYEYLSGLAVAVLILLIGVELLRTSVQKIIHPQRTEFTLLTFSVLLVSIGAKAWLSGFFRTIGTRFRSTALQATAADCRNDAVASAAILSGCLVSYFFHINIDGYVGLGAAGFILWSGIKTLKDTASPLLGRQADDQLILQLTQLILSHTQVLGIHDLLIHDYGPGQCYASVHAEVSAGDDPVLCHDLADHIERRVLEAFGIQLVIHCDPVAVNDLEQQRLQRLLSQILADIHPKLSFHDLRIVREAGSERLLFDLTLPYALLPQQEALRAEIAGALAQKGITLPIEIQFDGTE